MQYLSSELLQVLAERLKTGERTRPVQRVEVDRLVFIPGRTEEIEFTTIETQTEKEVVRRWIPESVDGAGNVTYNGETTPTSVNIVFPVAGRSLANMSSPFGMRWGRMHNGIDIHALVGETVRAAWAGQVISVVHNLYNGYGNFIDILHEGNILTRYAHLSEMSVRKGDQVTAGSPIGKTGNTGDVHSSLVGAVTGSYDDPTSHRAQGRGSHLHFEIRVPNADKDRKPVDPVLYLNGTVKLPGATNFVGQNIQTGETFRGIPGAVRLDEDFRQRNWFRNERYAVDSNWNTFYRPASGAAVGIDRQVARWVFSTDSVLAPFGQTGFNVRLNMEYGGFMTVQLFSNFMDGDEFRIFQNGALVQRMTKFNADKLDTLKDIALPPGELDIRFEIQWRNLPSRRRFVNYYFALASLQVQELIEDTQAHVPVETVGRWEEETIEKFIFNEKKEKVELPVGQFVYWDTLVLDNVQSIDIDNQFEAESMEATITITNPDGFFSPLYSPHLFPENAQDSPWSHVVNGVRVGVLCENTPIRIFLGYGQHLPRVFTGLIDKVEILSEHTITISCKDMYKKIANKVLLEKKAYPDPINPMETKMAWIKSAVVHDLVHYAGMFGWRANPQDIHYPDAIIEETYLISVDAETGTVIRAIPDKEGEFEAVPIESIKTPQGWMNPFVEEYGRTFEAFKHKVADCLSEILQDTNLRSYCDRYGTYRLEAIRLDKPIVAEFSEHQNLVSISNVIDLSRARSHLVVWDSDGKYANFVDNELLIALKGEVRTAVIDAQWAKTPEMKSLVAERAFFDMKRMCYTAQVSIVGNPLLEVLDRVMVVNSTSTTRGVYLIKGIRSSFNKGTGYIQSVDLMWVGGV